jgi:hypothetical protein
VFAATVGRHKRGTVFSFQLGEPAEVTIEIERRAPGRRVGQRCGRPSTRLRHKPRCTRTIMVARLSEQGHAGGNKVAFSGRDRGRTLKPGHYLAVFAATNRAGASKAQTLHFTIIRS